MERLPAALDAGPAMSNFCKILCIGLLALAWGSGAAQSAAAEGRPIENAHGSALLRAGLFQSGQNLVFSVRTAAAVPLARLEPLPGGAQASGPYLCLALAPAGGRSEQRLCLGGGQPLRQIGLESIDASGRTTHEGTVAARVRRPSAGKLLVSVLPAAVGLTPRRYR